MTKISPTTSVSYKTLSLLDGVQPVNDDAFELLLNSTWRPQLSVTGISGLPDNAVAGNIVFRESQ